MAHHANLTGLAQWAVGPYSISQYPYFVAFRYYFVGRWKLGHKIGRCVLVDGGMNGHGVTHRFLSLVRVVLIKVIRRDLVRPPGYFPARLRA